MFYSLSKEERTKLTAKNHQNILKDLQSGTNKNIIKLFSDDDTYIRKNAYISIGKIYKSEKSVQQKITKELDTLIKSKNEKIRQTTINAAGEIGIKEFEIVEYFFDKGLFDDHSIVRNAVIGSIKKMGEKNPKPILRWAKKYLHHEDKEIRREICHGIELRGRTHPQDILPLLKELQHDKTTRVKNTLIHVLGQISYKKGCFETVIAHLKTWENEYIIEKAIEEIIDVHERYKNFAVLTQKQVKLYIDKNF